MWDIGSAIYHILAFWAFDLIELHATMLVMYSWIRKWWKRTGELQLLTPQHTTRKGSHVFQVDCSLWHELVFKTIKIVLMPNSVSFTTNSVFNIHEIQANCVCICAVTKTPISSLCFYFFFVFNPKPYIALLVTWYCALRRKYSLCALHTPVLREQKGWDRGRWVGSPAGWHVIGNQQLRLLRNERKTAVRRKATWRDGAFEESLPSSE